MKPTSSMPLQFTSSPRLGPSGAKAASTALRPVASISWRMAAQKILVKESLNFKMLSKRRDGKQTLMDTSQYLLANDKLFNGIPASQRKFTLFVSVIVVASTRVYWAETCTQC